MLGIIRKEIKDSRASVLILIETISRVMKNEINRQLRDRAQLLKNFTQEPYRRLIANILNQIFGKENFGFWDYISTKAIPHQFPLSLSAPEQQLSGYQLAHLVFLTTLNKPPVRDQNGVITPEVMKRNSLSSVNLSSDWESNNESAYPPSISLIMDSLRHTLLCHSTLIRKCSKTIFLKVAVPLKHRPDEYTIDTQHLKVSSGSPIQGQPDVVITISFDSLVSIVSKNDWTEPRDLSKLEQLRSIEIHGNLKSAEIFFFDILAKVIRPLRHFSESNFLMDGKFWLLMNIQEKLGITFQTPVSMHKYKDSRFREQLWKSNIPFTSLDLASIEGRLSKQIH